MSQLIWPTLTKTEVANPQIIEWTNATWEELRNQTSDEEDYTMPILEYYANYSYSILNKNRKILNIDKKS